jgi:hypothetical protein
VCPNDPEENPREENQRRRLLLLKREKEKQRTPNPKAAEDKPGLLGGSVADREGNETVTSLGMLPWESWVRSRRFSNWSSAGEPADASNSRRHTIAKDAPLSFQGNP